MTKQKLYNRKVKKIAHPLVSCHDEHSGGKRERKDMCRNCINYLDLHPKLKPQAKMGARYYRCLGRKNIPSDLSAGLQDESTEDDTISEPSFVDTPEHERNVVRHCITDTYSAEGSAKK